MRIRRTLPVMLAVIVVAAAVTIAVQLRKHAPPEPARLLPGADAFFYLNLNWARKANSGKELPAVSHDPEYEQFIHETGFQFERDLDEAAFAIHYPANWPGGGTGGTAREPRFSEIFVGKFDGGKLSDYLKRHSRSVENYESVDIFSVPVEQRTLRVAILGADAVAASNHDDPAVIRGMVDRSRKLASPFGGPAMLRRYYKRVQFSSPVWLVAHLQPTADRLQWSDFLPHPCDLVLSASYNPLHIPLHSPGAVHVRAEAFTANADDARDIAAKLTTALALFHTAESAVGNNGTDPDVKAVFDSLKVEQENSHATVSANVPPGFLKKLLSEPAGIPASSLPTAAPQR